MAMEPWVVSMICLIVFIFCMSIATLVLVAISDGHDSKGHDSSGGGGGGGGGDSSGGGGGDSSGGGGGDSSGGGGDSSGGDDNLPPQDVYVRTRTGTQYCSRDGCCATGVFSLYYYGQASLDDANRKPWEHFTIGYSRYVNCDGYEMGCDTVRDSSGYGATWELAEGSSFDDPTFTMKCEIQLPYMCLTSKMYTDVGKSDRSFYGIGSVHVTYADPDNDFTGSADLYLVNNTKYACGSSIRTSSYTYCSGDFPNCGKNQQSADRNLGYDWTTTATEEPCLNCACSSGSDASTCYIQDDIDKFYHYCDAPTYADSKYSYLRTPGCDYATGWSIYC